MISYCKSFCNVCSSISYVFIFSLQKIVLKKFNRMVSKIKASLMSYAVVKTVTALGLELNFVNLEDFVVRPVQLLIQTSRFKSIIC